MLNIILTVSCGHMKWSHGFILGKMLISTLCASVSTPPFSLVSGMPLMRILVSASPPKSGGAYFTVLLMEVGGVWYV